MKDTNRFKTTGSLDNGYFDKKQSYFMSLKTNILNLKRLFIQKLMCNKKTRNFRKDRDKKPVTHYIRVPAYAF